MALLRKLAGTAGFRTLVAILVAMLGWQVFLAVQGPTKISDSLTDVAADETVDVIVELNFPAERFHILTLQDYGRISGSSGAELQMRSVPASTLNDIARIFWVKSISPLEESAQRPIHAVRT